RVLALKQPAWFIGMNVAHFDGTPLEQVVFDLETLVYEVAPPLEVPACAFGLDHWRRRLWILGYANRHRQSGLSVDAEVARLSRARDDAGSVGTADGISGGLDARRMAAIGNAVVPHIAEWIGRNMIEAHHQRRSA